jgi:arylsulfatase A-like enzyme
MSVLPLMNRRQFLARTGAAALIPLLSCQHSSQKPNILFVFADQWRAQDTGYAGNTIVKTPSLDKLAAQSVNFAQAVSGCPVCSPYRASLLTGQFPVKHGLFYNDKPLNADITSMGKLFAQAGYDTAYIGKWHLNGHQPGETYRESRNRPVPAERRQGFNFWRARECSHAYMNSIYYDEQNEKKTWQGYDAIAQTKAAADYIQQHPKDNPFLMVLSWGPPHAPYHTAPHRYQELFPSTGIDIRKNVPSELHDKARKDIAGYYGHISALDECIGNLISTLDETGLTENTIVVFTSDHGDMLYSHGQIKKQQPWEESVRVPFLLRYPALHGSNGRTLDTPLNTPDILPTLLALASIDIPDSVQGDDLSGYIKGIAVENKEFALLSCPVPFHQWNYHRGGREYRGLRNKSFTYVRDLNGPWLLFDNQNDPYQLNNLVNNSKYSQLVRELDKKLDARLAAIGDEFLPGPVYMQRWNYHWDGEDAPA